MTPAVARLLGVFAVGGALLLLKRKGGVLSASSRVLVAAHRACHGKRSGIPENSLIALQKCVEEGIDIIEIDIFATRDGHYVLMHDSTVERTTNGNKRVKDYTLAEIKQLRLREGEGRGGEGRLTSHTVPSLAEALAVVSGSHALLNLDKLSSPSEWKRMYQYLEGKGAEQRVLFKGSYRSSSLLSLRNLPKGMKVIPILRGPLSSQYLEELQTLASEGRAPFGVEIQQMGWVPTTESSRAQIALLRSLGIHVWVNTLFNYYDYNKSYFKRPRTSSDQPWPEGKSRWDILVDAGVDIIQTDYPEALVEYLAGRNLHAPLQPTIH